VENRVRLIAEIIRGIREKIGDRAAIDIRVSGNEMVVGGLQPSDFRHIAPIIEAAGVDMINVSMTVFESFDSIKKGKKEPQGRFAEIAAEIKSYADTPIGHVGFIADLDTAERLLEKGSIDLVGIGRSLFADPYLIQKTVEGRPNEVQKCIYDGKCFEDALKQADSQVRCTVNRKYRRKLKRPSRK
jgi:2,4-dienoyl-CoA reductase-like NADH-dependent reductase (Old Yellow Enzyme family)